MTSTEKLKMFRDCAQDIVTLPVRFVKYMHDAQKVADEANNNPLERDDYEAAPHGFLDDPRVFAGAMAFVMASVSFGAGATASALGADATLSTVFGAAGGFAFPALFLKATDGLLRSVGEDPDFSGKGRLALIKPLPSLYK